MGLPLLLGQAALVAAPFLLDYGIRGVRGLTGALDQPNFRSDIENSVFQPGPVATQLRMERLQRNMAVNEARLALYSPHTYQELSAGRRIPKGSTAIVGRPRRDLLEEVSYLMSTLPAQGQEDETSRRLSEIAGGI